MTDSEKREAERSGKLTPEVLMQRLRSGEVSVIRVECAAALGHPIAGQVAEPEAMPEFPAGRAVRACSRLSPEEILAWAEEILTFAGVDTAERLLGDGLSLYDSRGTQRLTSAWRSLHERGYRGQADVWYFFALGAFESGVPWDYTLSLLARYLIRDRPESY